MGIRLPIALALCAPVASAQSVLVVDDDGGAPFTEIQAAVDAAVLGDMILVHPGLYDAFTISAKSLVIHSATPTRPSVMGPVVIEDLAATDSVVLRGLEISEVPGDPPFFFFADPVLSILRCAGPVWIEDVATNTTDFPTTVTNETGTYVSECASVVFSDCELEAFEITGFASMNDEGLHAVDSTVSLYDTRLQGAGGNAFDTTLFAGGAGLRADGSTVFVSGCEIRGGPGRDGSNGPPFCIGLADGSDGGPGMVVDGAGSDVEVLDTAFVPGSGGLGDQTPGCIPGVSGSPGAGILHRAGSLAGIPGNARSMHSVSPVREGETIVETAIADPGDFVVFVFTLAQIPATPVPDAVGPAMVGFPAWFQKLGVVDASGEIVFTLPNTGILPSQFEYAILYKQAVVFDPTLAISISSPTMLLFLGAPF